MYEIVNRETGKCPLLLLTGLFNLSSYLLVICIGSSEVSLRFRVRVFLRGAIIQRLFYLTWLTLFEIKTTLKEKAKINKCYKQAQKTKQQDGKRIKNETKKQRKLANSKLYNKHGN